MKIYLAGKMDEKYGDWRDALLEGQSEDWNTGKKAPYWELAYRSGSVDLGQIGVRPWPREKNRRVLGMHDYVGPYRTTYLPEIDTKYSGYFHGSIVTGQHGMSSFEDHAAIVRECVGAIERADIVFAYLNSPDCFGTLAEIGMAHQMGKFIAIATSEAGTEDEYGYGWSGEGLWFIDSLADAVIPTYHDCMPRPPELTEELESSWSKEALEAKRAMREWEAHERDFVQGLLKESILKWTGREDKPVQPKTVSESDLYRAVAEVERRYAGVLQRYSDSFSHIAQWTSDPRVRGEAQRMLRLLTG